MQRRSSHWGNQVEIPGVIHEVGKDSVQYIIYRGPVIWNFLYIIVNSNSSETTEKELRRFSKDINEFLLKAPTVAKKSDDFKYS